jgi:integrase
MASSGFPNVLGQTERSFIAAHDGFYIVSITENGWPYIQFHGGSKTAYKGKMRPFGKTDGSLTDVHLPPGLADELRLWKQEAAKSSPNGLISPDAFIFPNSRGGFIDTGNYRNRVLNPLAEKLGLPKLNFQVMRRTMATQAQGMGSVKDIQAYLRHAKADTTANESMQELPESVKKMVDSVYTRLTKGGEFEQSSADLLPNATNSSEELALST